MTDSQVRDDQKLYEGKAKIIYATDTSRDLNYPTLRTMRRLLMRRRKGQIAQKGVINCKVTTHLYGLLEKKGVATHLIETTSDREMRVKRVDIVPLEGGGAQCCGGRGLWQADGDCVGDEAGEVAGGVLLQE